MFVSAWMFSVILGCAFVWSHSGTAAALTFAMRWGAFSALALSVGIDLQGRGAVILVAVVFAVSGLIQSVATSFESLMDVSILKHPVSIGVDQDIHRRYGINYSISNLGFQVAAGCISSLYLYFTLSDRRLRLLAAVMAALLYIGVFLTTSRGGIVYLHIGLLFGLVVSQIMDLKRAFISALAITAIAIVQIGVIFVVAPSFGSYLAQSVSLEDDGNQGRLSSIRDNLFSPNPSDPEATQVKQIQSRVAEDLQSVVDQVQNELQRGLDAESSLVRLWIETGPIGFSALVAFAIVLLIVTLRVDEWRLRFFLLSLGALILGFSFSFDLLKSWLGLSYMFIFVGMVLLHASIRATGRRRHAVDSGPCH